MLSAPMLQCEGCNNWYMPLELSRVRSELITRFLQRFHFRCIDLTPAAAMNIDSYFCEICTEVGAGVTQRKWFSLHLCLDSWRRVESGSQKGCCILKAIMLLPLFCPTVDVSNLCLLLLPLSAYHHEFEQTCCQSWASPWCGSLPKKTCTQRESAQADIHGRSQRSKRSKMKAGSCTENVHIRVAWLLMAYATVS